MKEWYSVIKTSDGFFDVIEEETQTLIKRYKTKQGAKNRKDFLDYVKRLEEGEKFVEKLDLSKFKLLPTAKPGLFHFKTVRGSISTNLWLKKIRPSILDRDKKTCSICGWIPEESETSKLHLHEVEEYDFYNVVCHLKDIELICVKCHGFHHIVRTRGFATKEQWEDLLDHFVKVNNCSPEVKDFWAAFEKKAAAFQREKENVNFKDLPPWDEISKKTVRYTVNSTLPYADEMIKQLKKKGLLFNQELVSEQAKTKI